MDGLQSMRNLNMNRLDRKINKNLILNFCIHYFINKLIDHIYCQEK